MINLDYLANEFHKELVELVNKYQLPPTLTYYILKDIIEEVAGYATKLRLQCEHEANGGNQEETITQTVPLNIIGLDKTEQSN